MANAELNNPRYRRLLAEKADRLDDLMHGKPGQPQYRTMLRAFMDADAKAEKALVKMVDRKLSKRAH
jgi:hypothetical protein